MTLPFRRGLARRRHSRPTSRGQAIVEFALILPVFLMLTLGVVDMTRVFSTYIMSTPLCTITGTTTTTTCTSTAPNAYDRVQIVVGYDVALITPLMTTLMGGPLHLTGSTTAMIQ